MGPEYWLGHKGIFGDKETFYTIIVVITQLHTFVKHHQIVGFKLVMFILHNYLNKVDEKWKGTDWKNIISIRVTDNRLMPRLYKKLLGKYKSSHNETSLQIHQIGKGDKKKSDRIECWQKWENQNKYTLLMGV